MAEITGGSVNTVKDFNRDQITKSYNPGQIFFGWGYL